MSEATAFSVATNQDVLDAIDRNAQRQGLSRSAYVLQWLPEAQEDLSERGLDQRGNRRRKAPRRAESLASAQ